MCSAHSVIVTGLRSRLLPPRLNVDVVHEETDDSVELITNNNSMYQGTLGVRCLTGWSAIHSVKLRDTKIQKSKLAAVSSHYRHI